MFTAFFTQVIVPQKPSALCENAVHFLLTKGLNVRALSVVMLNAKGPIPERSRTKSIRLHNFLFTIDGIFSN